MGFPEGLPRTFRPIEDADFLRPAAFLDGVDTTAIEVAIYEPGETRPLTGWVAWPGPVTPNTAGEYPVFIRATGANAPAECIGILVMY